MAVVPKRRVSKTKGLKRRTHYKVKLQMPIKDKNGNWKLPHTLNKETLSYK